MRRGECCGLKWKDVDFTEKSIHICRNVVKVTGENIIVKEPKTAAGDRYVYFSLEMASLLKEYRSFCQGELELHEGRELTIEDYLPPPWGRFAHDTQHFHLAVQIDFEEAQPAPGLERPQLAAHGSQFDDLRRGGCGYGFRAAGARSGVHYAGHLYSCF